MNFLYAVQDAISRCIQTGSALQLADAATATVNIGIQQKVYNNWTDKVKAAGDKVKELADKLAKDPDNKELQNELTGAQAAFQNMQTQQQTYTQQADSATQASQNQVAVGATAMQQKLQLAGAMNQLMAALSSALGQRL